MRRCKAVIFDLDGTLIDTAEDLAEAMNYALGLLGQPQHSTEQCTEMIGNGVKVFAQRALGPKAQHLQDELVGYMLRYYNANCLKNSRLYDGIKDLLVRLKHLSMKVAVVTNKNQPDAEKVLEHFFGRDFFDCIIGVDEDTPAKPDPQGTIKAMNCLGLDKSEVLLVGDSDVDVTTAGIAGLQCVGAAWGFRGRAFLETSGADAVIDRPDDLLDLLA